VTAPAAPRPAARDLLPFFLAPLGLWAFMPFCLDNQDIAFHLATGAWIAAHRALPATDPFSFTLAGVRWVNPEWGFQVLCDALWRLGGTPALVAMKAAVLAGVAALLVGAAGRLGPPEGRTARRWIATALLWLAAPACVYRFTLRPQIFGYLGEAATFALLARAAELRPGRSRAAAWGWLAALLPIHVLWVNVHGSMVLGAALVAAFAVRRRGALPFVAAALALPLAWLANPWGAEVVRWPLEHLAGAETYRAIVTEWRAPFARAPDAALVVFAAWLGAAPALLAGAWWVRRTAQVCGLAAHAAALTGLAFLAVTSERFGADFVLAAATLGAVHVEAILRTAAARGRLPLRAPARAPAAPTPARAAAAPAPAAPTPARAAALAVAAVTAALVLLTGVHSWPAVEDRPHVPAGPVDFFARSGWNGRLFDGYDDGAWLLWKSWPAVSPYLDTRAIHGPAALETIFRDVLPDPSRFEAEVDRWAIGAALCDLWDPNFEPLRRYLDGAHDRWTLVYLDPSHALYLRTGAGAPAGNDALAARFRLRALRPAHGLGYLLAPGVARADVLADVARLETEPRARPLALAAAGLLDLADAGLPGDRLSEPPSASPALARALARLDEAAAARPDEPTFLYFDGLARAHAGRLDDAAPPLREAARLEPATPAIWIALFWVERARGDSGAAAGARDRALELLPPGHPARRALE